MEEGKTVLASLLRRMNHAFKNLFPRRTAQPRRAGLDVRGDQRAATYLGGGYP
ncbi:MAG: hypothetical protein GX147_02340 [Deltaproteobacteria bacterium]|nr:hypothetical protein [Deltaproteobacteria bacterium]